VHGTFITFPVQLLLGTAHLEVASEQEHELDPCLIVNVLVQLAVRVGSQKSESLGDLGPLARRDHNDPRVADAAFDNGDVPDVGSLLAGDEEFESIDVLVSEDNEQFFSVKDSEASLVRIPGDEARTDGSFARSYDLAASGLSAVRYVRVAGVEEVTTDGFDLDAVGAIHYTACLEPVVPETRFRRGDCNNDGGVDLSDAVCTLSWLFLGGRTPSCLAAANTNGDAAVDIA
jgi:hypothetical protein